MRACMAGSASTTGAVLSEREKRCRLTHALTATAGVAAAVATTDGVISGFAGAAGTGAGAGAAATTACPHAPGCIGRTLVLFRELISHCEQVRKLALGEISETTRIPG